MKSASIVGILPIVFGVVALARGPSIFDLLNKRLVSGKICYLDKGDLP